MVVFHTQTGEGFASPSGWGTGSSTWLCPCQQRTLLNCIHFGCPPLPTVPGSKHRPSGWTASTFPAGPSHWNPVCLFFFKANFEAQSLLLLRAPFRASLTRNYFMLHPRRSRGCRGSTFWWGSTSPFVKTAQKHLAPCLVVIGDDVTSRASVYLRRGNLRDNQRGSRVSEAAGSGTCLHTARFPVVRKQFPYRAFKITFTRFFSVWMGVHRA